MAVLVILLPLNATVSMDCYVIVVTGLYAKSQSTSFCWLALLYFLITSNSFIV